MKANTRPLAHVLQLGAALTLSLSMAACSEDSVEKDSATSEDSITTDSAEEPPQIGNSFGEALAIDHATAQKTVEDNLIKHMDAMDSALTFVEDSNSLNTLFNLIAGDDDEEGDEQEEDGIEIDFADLRDGIVEIVSTKIMVEETATVSDDGKSITYHLQPEYFCVSDDVEEDESAEEMAERLAEEEDCSNRLSENPLFVEVKSDAAGDMNFALQVGQAKVEALSLQLHDDLLAGFTDLHKLKTFLQVLIDEKDFEMPQTMQGYVAGEVRQTGNLAYTAQFAIMEKVNVLSEDETISIQLKQDYSPGMITLDGIAASIKGELNMDSIDVNIPWQTMVDMFHDDEGHNEWVCETNENGEEECYDEYVPAPEAPDVEGALQMLIPGVSAAIDFAAADDILKLSSLGLGASTTSIKVNDKPIIAFDVNANDGRQFDLAIHSDAAESLSIEFAPKFDAQIQFSMENVSDDIEDLPQVLLDETIGARLDGSSAPTLELQTGEEFQMKMISGALTLWSSAMVEDVVVEEGQCMGSVDEESLTEEEEEALHELFGKLLGESCPN